jgi:peptidoglycan/xylan/chitin deacetylase (PgdA/CDA1 family)
MLAALLFSSAVALTFDDLPGSAIPVADRCNAAALSGWNAKLLASLRRHHAPALGLVNSGRPCVSGDLADILELWLRDGHQLGNHTAHHLDANAIRAADFERDIMEGETPLRELLRRHGQKLVWFRYPMLHTGGTVAKRDEIAGFLRRRGYRDAVVTLDSDEYLYNNAYAAAIDRGDHARAERIAKAYLPFMESITAFFETRTKQVVGREIPHVLLLHMSALNADHLDELLTMFERRGYRFISIDEAMRDPAYSLPDGYAGKAGLSWIHRWGAGKGMPIVMEPGASVPESY